MAEIGELKLLVRQCNQISRDAADHSGFVPIKSLLSLFNAELRLRPLLVEGMLGSFTAEDTASNPRSKWLVFVDSGRYSYSAKDIEEETYRNPLAQRFRFTIAHELAHTLAFRRQDGSFESRISDDNRESRAALVKTIERETDQITSLLLCSEDFLRNRIASLKEPINVGFLTELRRMFGISRDALICRLAASRAHDQTGLWQRPHTSSFGVFTEDWDPSGRRQFRKWPVFANFSRGLYPEILSRVASGEPSTEQELSVDKKQWEAASSIIHYFRGYAGTQSNPRAAEMDLEITRETQASAAHPRSLVLVQDRKAWEEVAEFERLKLSRRASRNA